MQKESSTAIYSNIGGAMKRPLSKQQLQPLRYQEEPLLSLLSFSQHSDLLPPPQIKRVKSSSHLTPFYLSETFSYTPILTNPTVTVLSNTNIHQTNTTPMINAISSLPIEISEFQKPLSPCHHQFCPHHDFIMNNKIMDMSSEPSIETVLSRIRYNKELKRLVLNFEGLHVCKREHIRNVRDSIEGVVLAYHPNEHVKVQCIVNYDNYIIDDHLMDEYTESVVVYLQKYYDTIERFTTNNFLQEQVKKLETALTRYRKSSIISPKVNVGKRIVGSRYVIQDLLGVGTYGRVSLAQDRESGDLVAIKELSKHKVNSIGIMDWVRREIQILKTLGKHPLICTLFDVIETEETIFLIIEYVENGAIETPYDEHQQFPEETCRKYFKQMTDALDYIHNVHNVCHRDFQLSNVCLDKNGNVKVCDFGVADFFTMKEKTHQLFVGNSNYSSPEMLMKKPYYGPEIDVYMLGVCLYKMMTGFLPFRNAQAKLMGCMTVPLEEEEDMSDDCKDLIRRLLDPEPEKRITIRQIKDHPYYLRTE